MSNELILTTGLGIMSVIGMNMVWTSIQHRSTNNLLKRRLKSKELSEDDIFTENFYILEFYNLTSGKYNRVRYTILFVGILMLLVNYKTYGFLDTRLLVITLAIFVLTEPREKVYGFKSIASMLVKSLEHSFKMDVDSEIHNMTTMLINIELSERDNLVNPVSIVERLIDSSGKTKKIFQVLLERWQLGDTAGGIDYFNRKLNTPYASKFSNILSNLDNTTLNELVEQLKILQTLYRESQLSKEKLSSEKKSLQIFTPVLISAFLVLINFVLVGVFLPSMSMIGTIQ